jgi:two-component system phosphate regulon sensor histidine kinase PhoR
LERLRQEFTSNVSHELKTPLSVIKACTESLIDGAADDLVMRREFLQQIDEQADRLHALILDLISLGRIETGKEVLTFDALDLQRVVVDCLDRHRPRSASHGLTLTLEATPAADFTVLADQEAVEQILDNLVDNAIKYTPSGGHINVRLARIGEQIRLDVMDTGIGIPERDLPRIFERFYRVDKARSRQLGGTGLGLSIVKHLVQLHQGAVDAVSSVGFGSTFTVTLPAITT